MGPTDASQRQEEFECQQPTRNRPAARRSPIRQPAPVVVHHSSFVESPAENQFDMTGAIVATATLAFLCSVVATIGNFAISRDFPDVGSEGDANPLLDSKQIRFMQYRWATNLFYHQALVLWSLAGMLLVVRLLFSF
jgi:hypothetical protein